LLAHGEQHQAGHIVDLQAFHDLRAVGFDSLDAQAQAIGNFPGGFSANNQSQDFQLACRQVVRVLGWRLIFLGSGQRLVDDGVGNGRAQVAFVIAQGIQGMFELGGRGVFEQVAMSPGFECLHDERRVGVHRQDEHFALRTYSFESLQGFKATGFPHGDIQQDDVRGQLLDHLE